MINQLAFGQYLPGETPVHKVDPRVKLVLVLLYMGALFAVRNVGGYLWLGALLVAALAAARIPVKAVWQGQRPFLWMFGLTLLLNVLLTPGQVLWQWWILRITAEGLHDATFFSLRLILLLTTGWLLTLTTSPIALTDGLERLLKPLARLGFPAHELALMMTIALRFIPTLFEETDKIIKAQKARGADFEGGSPLRRLGHLASVLIPLFVAAFRRADDLALAMEARAYAGGEGRTRYRELHYSWGDAIAVALFIAAVGAALAPEVAAWRP